MKVKVGPRKVFLLEQNGPLSQKAGYAQNVEQKNPILRWKRYLLSQYIRSFQKLFVYFIAVAFLSLQFFLQIVSTVMVKPLMQDFNVGAVGVSNLSAMLFYGYILWLIPGGLILDYFGSRKSILLACLILGIGCLTFGYSHNVTIASIGRLLMGIGSAFAFINLLYIVNDWFPTKYFALIASFGETFSIITASIFSMILPRAMPYLGWRLIIVLSGLVSIAMFIFTLLFFNDDIRDLKKNANNLISPTQLILTVINDKQIWLLGVYGLCVFSLITVFSSLWGVPFITKVYQYDINSATTAVMIVPFGVGVGCLIMGLISSALSKNKPIMLIAPLICALLMSIVILIPKIPYDLLIILLFSCGFFSATYIQVYSVAKSSFSENIHGSVMSIITIIIMSGAPLLQIFLGWLLQTHFFNLTSNGTDSFRLSLLIIPICLFLAFVITFNIKEQKQTSLSKRQEL